MTDHTPELKQIIIEALDDLKATDINILDVTTMTSITDSMIIATGTSSRHVKSLADLVIESSKKKGYRPLGSEGGPGSEWVLVDLGDIIVHVMTATAREFYDLDGLWSMTLNNSSSVERPTE